MSDLIKNSDDSVRSKLADKLKSNRSLLAQRHILIHFNKEDLEINGSIQTLWEDNVIEDENDLKKLTDTAGSKFHRSAFKNPLEVITFIEEKVKDAPQLIVFDNDKAYLQIELNQVVGFNNVIAIKDLPENSIVTTGKRGNFNDANLVSGIPYPTTHHFSAILTKELNFIETAHPGPISPQFPAPYQSEELQKVNSDYWKNHAFIINA
jgi:hypothetical protein